MRALLFIISVYVICGGLTVWFVSHMPWILSLKEVALIGLQWPLFWFQYLRS